MKTWAEKLSSGKPYEVKPEPINIAGMRAGEITLVPTARHVDEFIRALPKGKHLHIKTLRHLLANQNSAEVACPIATGFHLRTVAEAAFGTYQNNGDLTTVTPFWRLLNAHTPTISRLSFGTAFVTEQRLSEGLKD